MELTLKQRAAFGIGAVGKDMAYALSAAPAPRVRADDLLRRD